MTWSSRRFTRKSPYMDAGSELLEDIKVAHECSEGLRFIFTKFIFQITLETNFLTI